MLHVPFSKMQGAGNDFIVLDNRFFHFSTKELAMLARRFCRRRFGVGADGLLALAGPSVEGADYAMRYHNADGSIAGMCGNGARCLARFARTAGLGAEPLTFESAAGLYRASVPEDARAPVRLFVPSPRDFDEGFDPGDGSPAPYINTGTHHVVLFVDDVDAVDPETLAPPIRHHPRFQPEGTNVNFVQVIGADRIQVRTFEKGVEAETLACGTGAMAAALVTNLTGRSAETAFSVYARGGELRVGWQTEGGAIAGLYLEGPAEEVFTGVLEIDPRDLGE